MLAWTTAVMAKGILDEHMNLGDLTPSLWAPLTTLREH